MKLKDIEIGKYYAVGSNTAFGYMERLMVVSIGKWAETWGFQEQAKQLREVGKRQVVGVCVQQRWSNKWKPAVFPAQKIWGLWEDWEKEQERQEEEREQKKQKELSQKEERGEKAGKLHARLLALGFKKEGYHRNLPEAQGFDLSLFHHHAKVKWEALERLISLAEQAKPKGD